jgi:hypothetical protein
LDLPIWTSAQTDLEILFFVISKSGENFTLSVHPVNRCTPLDDCTRPPPLSGEFRLMMPKDLKELLRAFNDHAVKHLIV